MLHLLDKKEGDLLFHKKIIIVLLTLIFMSSFSTYIYFLLNQDKPSSLTLAQALPALSILYLFTIILSVVAYMSCLLYYITTKNQNYFLVSLVYLNLCILNLLEYNGDFYQINYLNSIFRIVIVLFIINNKSLFKSKFFSTIIVTIFTVCLNFLDTIIYSRLLSYPNILSSLLIILLLANLIISIILSVRCYRECDYLYIFMIASLAALSLRGTPTPYIHTSLENGVYVSILYKKIIFLILSFSMAICGVFVELIRLIKYKTSLENQLKIFYDFTENNTFENIAILDKNFEVCYKNKKLSQNYEKYDTMKNLSDKITHIFTGNQLSDYYNINLKSIAENHYCYIYHDKISNSYFDASLQKININKSKHYYLLSFKDITNEHILNLTYKKNEEFLKNINDNIQDIIIGITDNGIIEYVNKAALDSFKYNEDELLGRSYLDFIDSDDDFKSSFFKNIDVNINYKIINKLNTIVELDSKITNLEYIEFSSIKKVIVSKDLTQKNKFDNLKIKYNEIKAYDKSKNEFFANLSHELKTPLNIIYSTVQLFEKIQSKDDASFKNFYIKYKNALRLNCLRMMRLVNNLIDITKVDANSIDVNFINLNIIEFIEHITLSIIPYANMKNLNVIFDTDNEEVFIKCDPEKIERVILNLLSNAIKFTNPSKSIYINIETNKDWIDIYVKDEGIGIPENMKNLIFDRFVQIDKSLTRNTEGSGIGLSIVKSLVDIHDGKITLDSIPDVGTTFKVSLPNKSLSYSTSTTNLSKYNTESDKIELELSDIYEVF